MRNRKLLLLAALFLLAACPVLAQAPSGGSGIGSGELKFLGAMIGMGLAAAGCGAGQGRAAAGAAEAMARNPGAGGGIRFALILGLVFIETLAIFTYSVFLTKY